MISFPLLTGIIGIATSGLLMLLSAIIPRFFIAKVELRLDSIRFGTKQLSKRESSVLGILFHLILSFFFGVIFGACAVAGMLSQGFLSFVIYWLFMSIVLGGVILPLEGHGFFGWKEDHWISVDLLAMNVLWVLIFWALLAVLI